MNSLINLVPLSELAEIVSGSTPDTQNEKYWENGDIPWITPADLTDHEGIFFTGNLRKITSLGYKSCSTRLLPKGSILFSSRAPIGQSAVTTFPLCTNQGFKSLIPNKRLDPIYGYFALKYQTPQIIAQGRGATFLEINKEIFEKIRIPLPPLPDQQRIAAILQKADRLRRLRRYARQLSDSYLQSVFLEMFGDPKNNPKGWEKLKLGNLIISAQDGPHVSPKYYDDGVPFLSTRNIRPGKVVWEDIKYVSIEDARKFWKRSGSKPEKGDILYTKGGTTGFAKQVDFDVQVAVWVHIAVLKLRKDLVVPIWLENMLNTNYCYEQSQELTFGIVNRDLGLNRMIRIELYLPPIDNQYNFEKMAHQYNSIQRKAIETERQTEHLFQSLMQRAFEGEL